MKICVECGCDKLIRYSKINSTAFVFDLPVTIPKEDFLICNDCSEVYNDVEHIDDCLTPVYRLYEKKYNILTNEEIIKIFNKSGMSSEEFCANYKLSKERLLVNDGSISKKSSDKLREDFGDIL